jgi:hypothetical protein
MSWPACCRPTFSRTEARSVTPFAAWTPSGQPLRRLGRRCRRAGVRRAVADARHGAAAGARAPRGRAAAHRGGAAGGRRRRSSWPARARQPASRRRRGGGAGAARVGRPVRRLGLPWSPALVRHTLVGAGAAVLAVRPPSTRDWLRIRPGRNHQRRHAPCAERVVAVGTAAKLRAEDGRAVAAVDVSPFNDGRSAARRAPSPRATPRARPRRRQAYKRRSRRARRAFF